MDKDLFKGYQEGDLHIPILHYIDDTLFMVEASTREARNVSICLDIFS